MKKWQFLEELLAQVALPHRIGGGVAAKSRTNCDSTLIWVWYNSVEPWRLMGWLLWAIQFGPRYEGHPPTLTDT